MSPTSSCGAPRSSARRSAPNSRTRARSRSCSRSSCILIYVGLRFQWKLGVGAIVAALHDPIVILGFFAATQMTFDLPALAAILAVIGYSLNDTVVVFDRVRERFLSTRKGTPAEVIDLAINQTLSRTFMTSLTTMIMSCALLFFGGEMLRGFSVALTIGVWSARIRRSTSPARSRST